MSLQISEIFYSLQGEGIHMGLPTIFIRTSGCNLRCSYCDTKYAYRNGKTMNIEMIQSEIDQFNCKKICITGGEPLLQDEIIQLITSLQKKEYDICLETNGSQPLQQIKDKKNLLISMDIKMPSSKMQHHNLYENINHLSKQDQLKCVIELKKDYIFAKKIIDQYRPMCHIIFQPVWGTNPKLLSSWILNDNLPVRFGIQLHKFIWENTKRK